MSLQETTEELNLQHANLCRALGDPKRIKILYALDHQPRHVSALASDLNLPQPTVSRHLRILRQHSLVVGERNGPAVIYDILDKRIIDVLDAVQEVMIDAPFRK